MQGLVAVLMLVGITSMCVGCIDPECDRNRERALSPYYGVKLRCSGSTCRAKLSPAEAHELASSMGTGTVHPGCEDIAALADARTSSGAMSDPCCHAGGSSCTHFYEVVMSESALALCIAL